MFVARGGLEEVDGGGLAGVVHGEAELCGVRGMGEGNERERREVSKSVSD